MTDTDGHRPGWSLRGRVLLAGAIVVALFAGLTGLAAERARVCLEPARIARLDGETFRVEWIETSEEGAYRMARALVDAAVDSGADRLTAWVPNLDWMGRAMRRAGCELQPMTVFATAL